MQKSNTNSNINDLTDLNDKSDLNNRSIKPSKTFNGFESMKTSVQGVNDDAMNELEEFGIDIQSRKSNIDHFLHATHDSMQNLFQASSRYIPAQK